MASHRSIYHSEARPGDRYWPRRADVTLSGRSRKGGWLWPRQGAKRTEPAFATRISRARARLCTARTTRCGGGGG